MKPVKQNTNTVKDIIEYTFVVNYRDSLKGYIYFLFDGDVIVYVGKTKNHPALRVHDHRTDKTFTSCRAMRFPIEKLSQVEADFISLLKPKYNTTFNTSFCEGRRPAKRWLREQNKIKFGAV